MISNLFHQLLYRPLFNALIFLYNTISVGDLGVAIIILTIIIRFILFPLFHKSAKHQAIMQRLQPKIKKIQHDHKEDKEKQAQALLALYREHKINPLSGIFLIFLQLPILLALFKVFNEGLSPESFTDLYSFINRPESLNTEFLGLINLSGKSIIMVGLSAVIQFVQGHLSLPKSTGDDDPAAKVGQYMIYVGPALTVLILLSLPAAVAVYWFTSSAFSIVQQLIINRSLEKENGNS